ncbi:MAG: CbiX/SirB N-terminal domain-containing protein [Verrucomicrobiota bacterium]
MPGEFSGATLVIVAHGSTLNPDSAVPAHQHADALRARGVFGQVLTGFWKQEPWLSAVLRGAWRPRVFVVPLFVSDGYFTDEVIPRELGFPREASGKFGRYLERAGQRIWYTRPVGTHPAMTRVILARAAEVVGARPEGDGPEERETSLFVAGHGTSNSETSRQAVEDQARRIGALGRFREVRAVFMEEEPRIEGCVGRASGREVVVVPFFMSDGLHSREDIPVLLGADPEAVQRRQQEGRPTWDNPTCRDGRRVWYARAVGTEPVLTEVILERVREAVDGSPGRGGRAGTG